MTGTHRPFPQPRWLLTVDHESCWLPGTPTFTPTGQIAFEADIGFLLTFHSWLIASIAGRKLTLDGVISGFDYELNEQQRYEFKSASVASLGFPTLDGAVKTPGRLTLSLNAKSLTPVPGSGQPATVSPTELPWRCSDFRLLIDQVNTGKVSHIDAIHMTIPGPLPKVNVHVPAVDIKQFVDWQKSGTPAASKIHLLAPDHTKALVTLSFTSKVSSIAHITNGHSLQPRKAPGPKTRVPVALNLMTLALTKG
jgi:hypothetical protein